MKIDFHTHGKLAKKLPFSSEYTDWLFCEARKAGLDALCLTEHFNTLGFEEIYQYISECYERDGDSFICKGLRIFPGMEVDIAEGGHVLVIGRMEDILEINKQLEPYKKKGEFLPFIELIDLVRPYPILLGAGHPYRQGGQIPSLSEEDLKQFNFIDLNGKDMAENGEHNENLIQALSRKLEIPYVAGSDTHQSFQYGCIYNDFQKECRTIKEIKEEMKEGNYTISLSNHIGFQVSTARILKRALKEMHELKGDYISILINEVE